MTSIIDKLLTYENQNKEEYARLKEKAEQERLVIQEKESKKPHPNELSDLFYFNGYFGIHRQSPTVLKDYLTKKLRGGILVDIEPGDWYDKARIAKMLEVDIYIALVSEGSDENAIVADNSYCKGIVTPAGTRSFFSPMNLEVVTSDFLEVLSRMPNESVNYTIDWRLAHRGCEWLDRMKYDERKLYVESAAREILRTMKSGGIFFTGDHIPYGGHPIVDVIQEVGKCLVGVKEDFPEQIDKSSPWQGKWFHKYFVLEKKEK